jgi:hypothetical protein
MEGFTERGKQVCPRTTSLTAQVWFLNECIVLKRFRDRCRPRVKYIVAYHGKYKYKYKYKIYL